MWKITESPTIFMPLARIIGALFPVAVLGALLLLGGAVAAGPAAAEEAQARWFDHAEVVEQLAARHKEAPTALGVTSGGAVLELFTTLDGSSWTIVLTLPNGMSRVIATGEGWMTRPQLAKGQMS